MRTGLAITLVIAALTSIIVLTVSVPVAARVSVYIRGVWLSFHAALICLLISDIIIRACEGMADIFVVLYVTNVLGISIAQYSVLVAIQIITSILVYIPAGRIADRVGRKPFVIATFACFALFPVAVAF